MSRFCAGMVSVFARHACVRLSSRMPTAGRGCGVSRRRGPGAKVIPSRPLCVPRVAAPASLRANASVTPFASSDDVPSPCPARPSGASLSKPSPSSVPRALLRLVVPSTGRWRWLASSSGRRVCRREFLRFLHGRTRPLGWRPICLGGDPQPHASSWISWAYSEFAGCIRCGWRHLEPASLRMDAPLTSVPTSGASGTAQPGG